MYLYMSEDDMLVGGTEMFNPDFLLLSGICMKPYYRATKNQTTISKIWRFLENIRAQETEKCYSNWHPINKRDVRNKRRIEGNFKTV